MRFFRGQPGRKLVSRGILRDFILIVSLLTIHFSWTTFGVGLAVFLVGCGLHFWSKGCLVRNWMVSTTGPYRLVRHPFYLANFVIDLGICIMSGNWLLLAAYVPLFFLIYIPVIQAEERDLRETHGQEYEAFSRHTPMILPYKPHRLLGPLDLSWSNIQREQEIPRLLRILAAPLFLVLAHLAWTMHYTQWLRSPLFLACAAGAVLLNVLSVLLRWDPFSDLAEAVSQGRH